MKKRYFSHVFFIFCFQALFLNVHANDLEYFSLGKFSVATYKTQKIKIITDHTAYAEGIANQFRQGAKSVGAIIIRDQESTNTSTGFTPKSKGISSQKNEIIDLIFYAGVDDSPIPTEIINDLNKTGVTIKFMENNGNCNSKLAQLARDIIGVKRVVCRDGVTRSMKEIRSDEMERLKYVCLRSHVNKSELTDCLNSAQKTVYPLPK
jgi:hypothetical protein